MENVLILGNSGRLDRMVNGKLSHASELLVRDSSQRDMQPHRNYLSFLRRTNVIVSLLGPMDVDIDFEALFHAVRQVHPPLNMFVMLSHAGVNHEVQGPLRYPGVRDFSEYANEQRYAAKVVDETEIPYTILRPVNFTPRTFTTPPRIIEEGHPVPCGVVSDRTVADLIFKIVTQRVYLNQSIAVIDKEGRYHD